MSLLDDEITLLNNTDIYSGFPNKEDYVYEPVIKQIDKLGTTAIDSYFHYYDITSNLFKSKSYSPDGLRIMAVTYPKIGTSFRIIAIDCLKLAVPYADFELGISQPIYDKNKLQDILYDFVGHIIKRPFDFLKIIEADCTFFTRLNALQFFFEINSKYSFIR